MGAVSLLAAVATGRLTVMVKRTSERFTLFTGFALPGAGNLLLNSTGQLPPLLPGSSCRNFTAPAMPDQQSSVSFNC
jgi:hypothetical protein